SPTDRALAFRWSRRAKATWLRTASCTRTSAPAFRWRRRADPALRRRICALGDGDLFACNDVECRGGDRDTDGKFGFHGPWRGLAAVSEALSRCGCTARGRLHGRFPSGLLPAALSPFGQVWTLGAERRVVTVAGVHPGLVRESLEQLLLHIADQRGERLGGRRLADASR